MPFEKDLEPELDHGFEGVNPAVLARWGSVTTAEEDGRPGPDWVTTGELASTWKITTGNALKRATRLVEEGRAETIKKSRGGSGGIQRYFRLKG